MERASVNGTELVVERIGAGNPILFIHGSSLDRRMWQPQVDALSSRFECITYDMRGFGRSAVPTGPFCHYEDAAALLEHAGITPARKAFVVGHSIGALYALELAFARPDLVGGIALICMSGLGTPPFPDDVIAMFGAVRTAAVEQGVDAAKAIWRESGWFAARRKSAGLRAAVDAMLDDYSGWYWLNPPVSQNLVPPPVERLEQLAMPALVIQGDEDLPYNAAVADELVRRIPDTQFLQLAAGHMANMEAPAPVSAALAELATTRVFTGARA